MTTTSIAQLIRENKTFRIASDIQTGARLGMISLDAHLLSLHGRNLISAEEAIAKAQAPDTMRERLMGSRQDLPKY